MTKKILRVDMDNLEANFEEVPDDYKVLGGRGLTSTIVTEEVPPECHPLGPNNKLVIAPGIVNGTGAPAGGRLSIGCKSPLTGGIKESNAGTDFAHMLARLQIKAIVVEGQADDGYYSLKITSDGVELEEADEWTGRGLYDVYKELYDELGEDVGICATGIAGELGGANSGVAFNCPDGLPIRYSGRGGAGAVMASRGLKLIILDDEDAPGVEIADEKTFKEGKKKLTQAIMKHDATKPDGALGSIGTSSILGIINEVGGLPHYNWSKGQSDEAENITGEEYVKEIEARGGQARSKHACSEGCPVQCSSVWTKPDGTDPVGVLEYESIALLGSNCGIFDLDVIGELTRQCNDLGLDTMDTGNAIAVAMEGGLLDFGDADGAMELLEEVREGTPIGRIIANGAKFTGQAFGVDRVPEVKGQAMSAYDPRAIKGIGVTYATTPMGADHTAGYTVLAETMGEMDPRDPDKVGLSRDSQVATAALDTVGHCMQIAAAILELDEGMEGYAKEISGVLGQQMTPDDIMGMGAEVIQKERKFNQAAGIGEEEDRLPEFINDEELPPSNGVFDVSEEDLDEVWQN